MPNDPQIDERPAQPYVAIRRDITMDTFADIADRFPELFAWLGERGLEFAGAPFFKYNRIDMEGALEVEACVPIAEPAEGDDAVLAGTLPAGRYAVVSHHGHPDGLIQVTTDLLEWADREGLGWDVTDTEQGPLWAARVEVYLTDPTTTPDMSEWDMQLMIKLAD